MWVTKPDTAPKAVRSEGKGAQIPPLGAGILPQSPSYFHRLQSLTRPFSKSKTSLQFKLCLS